MLGFVFLFVFFISILLVFVQKKHFLSVLLILELITLSLFAIVLLCVGTDLSRCGAGFSVIFLVFGVYEASNGLGLLVSRTRSSGIDQLGSLFTLRY